MASASILKCTGRSRSASARFRSDCKDSLFTCKSTFTGSSPVAIFAMASRRFDVSCSSLTFRSTFIASPVPFPAFWTASLISEVILSAFTSTSRSMVVFAASCADWIFFWRLCIIILDASVVCFHANSSTSALVCASMSWVDITCVISALAFFIRSNAWVIWSACVVIFSAKCSGNSVFISPQIESIETPLLASRTIFPTLFCKSSL